MSPLINLWVMTIMMIMMRINYDDHDDPDHDEVSLGEDVKDDG